MKRTRLAVAVAALSATLAAPMPLSAGEYVVDRATYSINESLTGVPGDADNGRKLAVNRKKGNCLACHTLPIPEQPFHGRIGPPLDTVAARYNAGQLRLRVVNPKELNQMSIMPAFYKSDGLHMVVKKFEGKSILTAQEVEDVVAYLETLK